jgi:hypothetical protein
MSIRNYKLLTRSGSRAVAVTFAARSVRTDLEERLQEYCGDKIVARETIYCHKDTLNCLSVLAACDLESNKLSTYSGSSKLFSKKPWVLAIDGVLEDIGKRTQLLKHDRTLPASNATMSKIIQPYEVALTRLSERTSMVQLNRVYDQLNIHSGSRKPFAEEAPVIDAARQAAEAISEKYGKPAGTAMFKGTTNLASTAKGHPQAVDIARATIDRLSSRSDDLDALLTAGAELEKVRALIEADQAAIMRRMEESRPGPALLQSLRRMGINV